jgi:hypothetical protein
MEYVTLQDIGKARWRAKRTLPGCSGDRTLRSERRCHHTGAEGATTRAHSPSDVSAVRWKKTEVTGDFAEGVLAGDESSNASEATGNPPEQHCSQNGTNILIRARRFAGETTHENGLGSKEKESHSNRYCMVQCYRYTILNVQI